MTMNLLSNSQYSNRPREGDEVQWWREWLVKIIFGLWNEKREILAKKGWPPRPISQSEIFEEKQRRTKMLQDEKMWGVHPDYPYTTDHPTPNWIQRRVNELTYETEGPKTSDGIIKIVCVSKRLGLYQPNPILFTKRS